MEQTKNQSWVFLGLVCCIGTMSQAQRFCKVYSGISFIVSGSSILDDTNTSNAEYGLLVGPAYLTVYAVVTVLMVRKT